MMSQGLAYPEGNAQTPVKQSKHVDDNYTRQHHPVPAVQYPPTHQHLVDHLPAPSPYTSLPTPLEVSPPTPSPVARIEPADTSSPHSKEAAWQRVAELARRNPPVLPAPASSSSRQSIQKLSAIKKNAEKKQALACLFCRERKIACGRPSLDNPDQTCKYVILAAT